MLYIYIYINTIISWLICNIIKANQMKNGCLIFFVVGYDLTFLFNRNKKDEIIPRNYNQVSLYNILTFALFRNREFCSHNRNTAL